MQEPDEREMLYGRQPVAEVLKAKRRQVFRLLVAENIRRAAAGVDDILKRAERDGVPVERTRPVTLDRLTKAGHHQGLVAEVAAYPYMRLEDLLEPRAKERGAPLYVVLDHIQDPQNLGAMLRTADSAGVDAVVLPKRRAAGVTPAAVRASSGAADHVKTAMVANLGEVIRRLKDAGFRVGGLDAAPEAVLYHEADLSGPLALVVGSEGEGLQPMVRGLCDFLVRIPQLGRIASMNAAAAGAVVVFEAVRQRRPGAPAGQPA